LGGEQGAAAEATDFSGRGLRGGVAATHAASGFRPGCANVDNAAKGLLLAVSWASRYSSSTVTRILAGVLSRYPIRMDLAWV